MKPRSRPGIDRQQAVAILQANGVDLLKPAILAMRGYYLDTMGKPGENDRGLYDDAMIVVSKTEFRTFNANTDPSRFRQGIATLLPGVHPYRLGYHRKGQPTGHPAFRPATKGEELPVKRDGIRDPWPGTAINLHKGGWTTTSSSGCQTVHPDQWDEFYALVRRVMTEYNIDVIPYCLVEQQG